MAKRSKLILIVTVIFPFLLLVSVSADSIIVDGWNKSYNGQILLRNGCSLSSYGSDSVAEFVGDITAEECTSKCLDHPACNHFNYYHDDRPNHTNSCYLRNLIAKLMPETTSLQWELDREQFRCGYVPNRLWQTSIDDNRVLVRSNCSFPSSTNERDVIRHEKSFTSCQSACLDDHRCNAFSYDKEERKCVLPYKRSEYESRLGPLSIKQELFKLHPPTSSLSGSADCAVVSTRNWDHRVSDAIIYAQSDCEFKGFDILVLHNQTNCFQSCFDNQRCSHFTHFDQFGNRTCHLKNAPVLTDRVPTQERLASLCGYIPDRLNSEWNTTRTRIRDETGLWRNDCDFALPIETKLNTTSAADCELKCFTSSTCNYFSHDGINCYLMLELELAQPKFKGKKGWTCGYDPGKIWKKSSEDDRILIMPQCTFLSSSVVARNEVINETSFSSCQSSCLEDHRCNAFSYDTDHKQCFIPHKAKEFEASWDYLSFSELFRLRSPMKTLFDRQCAVISTRNWKVDMRQIDSNSSVLLHQDDCDFNIGFDIEEPTEQKSFNDCIARCFSLKQCSHFSYSSSSRICYLKKAQARKRLRTDRVAAVGGRMCGYIPDRSISTDDNR